MSNMNMVRTWNSIRKADGKGLAAALKVMGMLVEGDAPLGDMQAAVQDMTQQHGGTDIKPSKASVSKWAKVYRAYVQDYGATPDEIAQRLVSAKGERTGHATLYRALQAAGGSDVAGAWHLIESGADLRSDAERGGGKGDAKDDDLSRIMSAVHSARKRGVSADDIVAALAAL